MVITRFAPSPTGHLHVGNLRTALFNYLIAYKASGTFILRLDDTDPERSRPEFADSIQRDLEWLGLQWSRLERQSNRLGRYQEVAQHLRKNNQLYECFESQSELSLRRKTLRNMGKPPIYDRSALALTEAEKDNLRNKSPSYWRFKLDSKKIHWHDGIQGQVGVDTSSLSDPVLIRADGQFLYTIASVVDDLDMNISDVVRGSDHITNTAVQIQIMHALGNQCPFFAHHSLLTGPSGEPLAKRLGTLSIGDLRDEGVEPMALLSMLTFLGTGLKLQLCSSLEELASHFQITAFSAATVKFDKIDLVSLTARCIAMLPFEEVQDEICRLNVPASMAEQFWRTVRKNLNRRDEIGDWWSIIRDGVEPQVADEDQKFIKEAFELLPAPPYNDQTWSDWTNSVSVHSGRKGRQLFMPLRRALTGKSHGPEMNKLMPLMQKIIRQT